MRYLGCILILLVGTTLANPRGPRDACTDVQDEYESCLHSAHEEHSKVIAAGDDGKPDFYSRKSCNYIEVTIEACGHLLIGECYSEEQVQLHKDTNFAAIIGNLEENEEWDSEMCPSVKEYKDRMAAGEGGEEAEATEVENGDEAEEAEAEDEEEDATAGDDDSDEDDGNSAVSTAISLPLIILVGASRLFQ